MKPSALARLLPSLYRGARHRPVWLWGPPGVGKSDIVRQAARSLGIEYLDVRMTYCDPGDIKFPIVENGSLRWVNSLFPTDPEWCGIVALEELAQAPALVQAVTMQATLDRHVGGEKISPGAMFVACSNRVEDRAGANRIITPVLSRFAHYDLDVSHDDWTRWAIDNEVHSSVVGMLQYKPDLLHRFDPLKQERAFPSPRTWHACSDQIKVVGREFHMEVARANVGQEGAADLIGYMEIEESLTKRFPIDQILLTPLNAQLPTHADGGIAWALAGALAERCKAKAKATVHAAMQYAMRLMDEYAIYTVRCILKEAGLMLALTAPGASAWYAARKHYFEAVK